MHYVFSTNDRLNLIKDHWKEELWSYMGGIAKKNDIMPIEIGGTSNHIHMLLSLPSTLKIKTPVQLVKGGSSRWLNNSKMESLDKFKWQEEYGVFSVSQSDIDDLVEYIRNQASHHQQMTFKEEFRTLLEKHGIEFKESICFDLRSSVVSKRRWWFYTESSMSFLFTTLISCSMYQYFHCICWRFDLYFRSLNPLRRNVHVRPAHFRSRLSSCSQRAPVASGRGIKIIKDQASCSGNSAHTAF